MKKTMKAMTQGFRALALAAGGRVTPRAERDPKGCLTISVLDNGIGIAPKDLERVLTPFAQVENVLSRKHDGTGLGLRLAKSFVELHGGDFELRSALGEGTAVTLRFPENRVCAPSDPEDLVWPEARRA